MSEPHHLDRLAISPTGFVFDPRSGATFSVNQTGRAILEGIRDGADLEAIVHELEAGFLTEDADPGADALEFVRLLREHGLLPADFELE